MCRQKRPARPCHIVSGPLSHHTGPGSGAAGWARWPLSWPDRGRPPGRPAAHPGRRLGLCRCRGAELRIDGTEVQVGRPPAGKPGRRAFVPGKKKQNTEKATVITGPRETPCGPARSARAACTTRPRSAPRASPTCSAGTPGHSQGRRRVPRPGRGVPGPGPGPAAEAGEGRHAGRPQNTKHGAASGHQNGSAPGTPAPGTSSGAPSGAASDDASTSTKPAPPSPDWSPTAPPSGNPGKPARQASTARR
jgi:hypothetical protein